MDSPCHAHNKVNSKVLANIKGIQTWDGKDMCAPPPYHRNWDLRLEKAGKFYEYKRDDLPARIFGLDMTRFLINLVI